MKRRPQAIKASFYRGNYQDVLEICRGQAGALDSDEDFSLVVGSLCFSGRKEEAEALYLRRSELKDPWSSACRFYLGTSFCRHGGYEKARSYFAKNLSAIRRVKRARTGRSKGADLREAELLRFYAMQGLGFYRYFCARFEGARKAAEQAVSSATLAGSSGTQGPAYHGYARAIATDLLGHSLVQLGSVRAGMTLLEEAETTAARLGDGGLARSISISCLVYRAYFGFAPSKAVSELRKAYRKLDPQNSHAFTNLLLELANQYMLRGELGEASKALEEASTWIYRSQHRRHGYLLTLRLAELGYRSGQYGSALHSVREVRARLDVRHDRLALLMALGLEQKLLAALGLYAPRAALLADLERLTITTGRATSLAILARSTAVSSLSSLRLRDSEDSVTRLLTGRAEEQPETARAIISSGFLGFLPDVLRVDRTGRWLVVGILGNDCVIIDQGETVYLRDGLPRQIYGLLELLSEGEKSRAVLVRQLWGYDYHPLRHDPGLYQAISRLRAFLGKHGDWVEATEFGYRLKSNVAVKVLRRSVHVKAAKPEPAASVQSGSGYRTPAGLELNGRQQRILAVLRSQEFAGVPDCAKAFRVTEMTLRRDFTALTQAGLVERFGQARSTRYRLR